MDRTPQSAPKHPLSSGMDHALDGEAQGPVKQLRRPGDSGPDMQSAANNSPQVKQLRANETAANAAVVQRKSANETGLPNALQAGMESTTGLSLDHVRVEYNSSKPAEVNALAYAEGSKIYVAPGQEKHLPEELGHVVQQMRGKVKATTQVGGKAINDDSGLEREAREMGAKAAAGPVAGGSPAGGATLLKPAVDKEAPIQRRVYEPFAGVYQGNWNTMSTQVQQLMINAKSAAATIDNIVQQQRKVAISWAGLSAGGEKHLINWKKVAKAYFDNPAKVPKVLYARFGYAVETLAGKQLNGQQLNGFTVHLQESKGHTRPDIILKANNKDFAWVDITAEKSAGHIFGKTGSGWTQKPYVSEVIYDSLRPEEVLEAVNDPLMNDLSDFYGKKNKVESSEAKTEYAHLKNSLTNHQQSTPVYKKFNKEKKRKETQRYLEEDLKVNLLGKERINTRGMVKFLGLKDGDFGVVKGGQSNSAAVRHIYRLAEPSILKQHLGINHGRIEMTKQYLLQAGEKNKLVQEYLKEVKSVENSVKMAYLFLAQYPSHKPLDPENQLKALSIVRKQTQLAEKGITMGHTFKLMLQNRGQIFTSFFTSGVGLSKQTQPEINLKNAERRLEQMKVEDGSMEWQKCYFDLQKILATKEELQVENFITNFILEGLQDELGEDMNEMKNEDFIDAEEELEKVDYYDEEDEISLSDEYDENDKMNFEELKEDFEGMTEEEAFIERTVDEFEESDEEDFSSETLEIDMGLIKN